MQHMIHFEDSAKFTIDH